MKTGYLIPAPRRVRVAVGASTVSEREPRNVPGFPTAYRRPHVLGAIWVDAGVTAG